MKNEQENQCVIITGESGAGKTEAAKLVMKYISAVSGNAAEIAYVKVLLAFLLPLFFSPPPLHFLSFLPLLPFLLSLIPKDVIFDSNPLLEAFGNAKTLRNNNSSRFGKYFEIQFNRLGDPCGGKITVYLLEKTRVVGRLIGERAFHIFYQMCFAASQQEKSTVPLSLLLLVASSSPSLAISLSFRCAVLIATADFALWDAQNYTYLNTSQCYQVDNMDDTKEWADTRKSMQTLSFNEQETYYIFRLLSAILHFGNLAMAEDGQDHVTFPQGEDGTFLPSLFSLFSLFSHFSSLAPSPPSLPHFDQPSTMLPLFSTSIPSHCALASRTAPSSRADRLTTFLTIEFRLLLLGPSSFFAFSLPFPSSIRYFHPSIPLPLHPPLSHLQ